MADLTPYDTGARAEPKVWKTKGDPDRYGKVDFEDDESATVATIYLERGASGAYVVVITPASDIGVSVVYDTPPIIPLPERTEERDG